MSLKLKINLPSKSDGAKRPEARKHDVVSTLSGLPKLKLIANNVTKKKKKKRDKSTKLKLKLNHHQRVADGSLVKLEEESSRSSNGSVSSSKPPKVRVKPQRTLGEGYDSEAPDVEDDPLIEQGIVIRFLNDTNLDFVHSAVDLGNYSGLNVKWITKDKAVVNVKGTLYAARLLDLPTVLELFKTLDKKNLFKTLDISQILLVIRVINPHNLNMERDFEVPEEYLYKHPFYRIVGDGEIRTNRMVLRDGLLNSFEDTYRRMRPRKINHRIMEDIDRRVNDLIKLDNEAVDSHFELVKTEDLRNKKFGTTSMLTSAAPTPLPTTHSNSSHQVTGEEAHNGQDISGSEAMETHYGMDDNEAASDLEEELARALDFDIDDVGEDEDDDEEGGLGGETPKVKIEGREDDDEDEDDEEDDEEDEEGEGDGEGAGGEGVEAQGEEEEEEEEEEEDDDDDEEDEEEEEEDEANDKKRTKLLEEEIKELEKTVAQHKDYIERAPNKIARKRFQNQHGILKVSLDNKKRELAKIQSELEAANAKADAHLFTNQEKGAQVNNEDDEDEEEEEEDEDDDDEMGGDDNENDNDNMGDDDQDLDGLF
ncbi:uncharacterized protein KQ657_003233 [Scheffersomyces spartinae]|uniref:TAFII55 protein conserved region domain-containing protein n=1 Tax=Scheffersomyces spartinae TaxID=45513 RepID=A0A9P7VCJ7_9ASCO|nr:uncharacterized protein KQ657_003233 [Scheffersomyces spartinae]KAG7195471.1 hypothetical protein KQ657_003233 [Scheffersomyces spartinae]